MDDDFEILAGKVISGDATEAENKRLRELLAKDARLQAEFDDLRVTWEAIREFGPLPQSSEPGETAPPAERMKEWRATVERKFTDGPAVPIRGEAQEEQNAVAQTHAAGRNIVPIWTLALAAVCVMAAVIAFLVAPSRATAPVVAYIVPGEGAVEIRRNGKILAVHSATWLTKVDQIRLSPGGSATVITPRGSMALQGPQTVLTASFLEGGVPEKTNGTTRRLEAALFEPPSQLLALLTTRRSSPGIVVYSPVGFTATATPAILWKAEPSKTYDVSVTDELAPAAKPLRSSGVVSPLQFTNLWPNRTLAPDGLYRLRITETGKPLSAGEVIFRTLPETDGPLPRGNSETLLAAYQMLTASPPRVGDALAVLLALPPELARSELALRLKLFAFGILGYAEDFEATLAQLQR